MQEAEENSKNNNENSINENPENLGIVNVVPENSLAMGPLFGKRLDDEPRKVENPLSSLGNKVKRINIDDVLFDYRNSKESLKKDQKQFISKKFTSEKQLRKFSRDIERLLNEVMDQNATSLESIKKILSTEGVKDLDRKTNIINAIVNSRKEGYNLAFNDNIFKRNLHTYIVGKPVKTKCLTNDSLNLLATCSLILEARKQNFTNQLSRCTLKSVKIVSDNFWLNQPAFKGYIQDYDPKFSAVCSQHFAKSTAMSTIYSDASNPELFKQFVSNNVTYKYFGTVDFAVVAPFEMSSKDISAKFEEMKYFYSDKSGFAVGEKKVLYNDLMYIDIKLTPDSFCPSFWATDEPINVNFLFDFEYDYNDLFEKISEKAKRGFTDLPENLCYWDTITQAFDFLAILALTCVNLPTETRKEWAKWVDTFIYLKTYIKKWRDNQMLLQRAITDFLEAITNKSEIIRFVHIFERVHKYNLVYGILIDDASAYKQMYDFLQSLPFCKMIKNQLNPKLRNLSTQMAVTLHRLITGSKPDGVAEEIKGLYTSIVALLPNANASDPIGFEYALFPIITPPAGIMGQGLKFGTLNMQIKQLTDSVVKRRNKMRDKKKETGITFFTASAAIQDYLKDYWDAYTAEKGAKFGATFNYSNDVQMPIFHQISTDEAVGQEFAEIATDYKNKKDKKRYELMKKPGEFYQFKLNKGNRNNVLQTVFDYYIDKYSLKSSNPVVDNSKEPNPYTGEGPYLRSYDKDAEQEKLTEIMAGHKRKRDKNAKTNEDNIIKNN